MIAPLLLALLQGVQVEGTVRDSAAGLPIANVVVQLLDSAGAPRGRDISNLQGHYRVASTGPVQRLQFLRMGYRPRTVTVAAWAGRDTTLNVTMTRIPSMLARVQSQSNRLCPRRRDAESAFALWEQARLGLMQTIVAREQLRARLLMARSARALDRASERILWQSVRLHTQPEGAVAFHAVYGARDFMTLGFVDRPGDGVHRIYFGPDAETLLHPEFQVGYCFSLADRQADRPGQVGLHFAPARRMNDRVDLDGVLWVDTLARAMVDVEWRYIGLEAGAARYRSGGAAMFEMLPNGLTVLNRWSIRGARFRIDSTLAHLALRQGVPAPTLPRVYSVSEAGGELLRALFPDGSEWRADLGTLDLKLRDRRGRPVKGREIRPDSTDYVATTDSTGRAVIEDLIPGPYRIDLRDTVIRTLRTARNDTLWFEAARSVVRDTTLAVETVQMLVTPFCGDSALRDASTHIILGRVTTTGNNPIRLVEWEYNDGVSYITGRGNRDGLFAICLTPTMWSNIARGRPNDPVLELKMWDRVQGSVRGVPRILELPLSTGKLTFFHYTWLPLASYDRPPRSGSK